MLRIFPGIRTSVLFISLDLWDSCLTYYRDGRFTIDVTYGMNMESHKSTSKSPKDPYKNCCLYKANVCGSWTKGRVVQEGLEDMANIEKMSVDDYLRNNLHLKPSDPSLFSQWNEKLLVENRIGNSRHSTEKFVHITGLRWGLGISHPPNVLTSYTRYPKLESRVQQHQNFRWLLLWV